MSGLGILKAQPRARTVSVSSVQSRKEKSIWSRNENQRFFRAMAEFTRVGNSGIKLLTMYLSREELELVESYEDDMTDDEIEEALREHTRGNNEARRPDLLFRTLRYLQRCSGEHTVREVNEKHKNSRQRYANRFINMFRDGSLPNSDPNRYIRALVGYLRRKAMVENLNNTENGVDGSDSDAGASPGGFSSLSSEKFDEIDQWLHAMRWLYPMEIDNFVRTCAMRVVTVHISYKPESKQSPLEKELLGLIEDTCASGLDNTLPQCSLEIQDNTTSLSGKKRKASEIGVLENNSIDEMTNEQKYKCSGMRTKLVASVGGVIRMDSILTDIDISYHLYRLWTCTARFTDIRDGLGHNDHAEDNSFSELVIVKNFSDRFEAQNVEPRIRVSANRHTSPNRNDIQQAIKNEIYRCQFEKIPRTEVPVWLCVSKNENESLTLSLVVTAPGARFIPTLGWISQRPVSDADLLPVIMNAVEMSGKGIVGKKFMRYIPGLEIWPWSLHQHNLVQKSPESGSAPFFMTGDSSVVASSHEMSGLDHAWYEPRVQSKVAYMWHKMLATSGMSSKSPSFNQLDECAQLLTHIAKQECTPPPSQQPPILASVQQNVVPNEANTTIQSAAENIPGLTSEDMLSILSSNFGIFNQDGGDKTSSFLNSNQFNGIPI